MAAGYNHQQALRRKDFLIAECVKTYKAMATATLKMGPGRTQAYPDRTNEQVCVPSLAINHLDRMSLTLSPE